MTLLSVLAQDMGVTTETKGLLNSFVLAKDFVTVENLIVWYYTQSIKIK